MCPRKLHTQQQKTEARHTHVDIKHSITREFISKSLKFAVSTNTSLPWTSSPRFQALNCSVRVEKRERAHLPSNYQFGGHARLSCSHFSEDLQLQAHSTENYYQNYFLISAADDFRWLALTNKAMILQPLLDFRSLSVVLKSKLVKETAEEEKEREVCFVIFIQLKQI